jgi:hypothetical protein
MKKYLCLLAALAACDMPVMSMQGATRSAVDIGGMSFNVFHTAERAEAHRTNFVLRPKAKQVFAAARAAIIQSSGCEVDEGSWSGDVALVKVKLLC